MKVNGREVSTRLSVAYERMNSYSSTVAIALTLCAIKSALQSPPVECEPWSPYPNPESPSGVRASASSNPYQRKSTAALDEVDKWLGRYKFPADDTQGRTMRGRCLE